MAQNFAALQVKLEIQADAFNRSMKAAQTSMNRMEKQTKKASLQLGNAGKQMKAFVGQAIAFAGIGFGVSFLKNIIEVNSQLAKSADIVGLSVEKFQELQFAATRSGVAAGQFASNMGALTKRMGELKNGTGPLVSGLRGMNDALLDSLQNSKNNEDAMGLIADAMQEAGTAADRARIANAAFSRSGLGMINMLKDGSDGLAQFSKEARDAGAVMNEDLVRNAEKYSDQLGDLNARIQTTFGTGFLKLIKTVMDNAAGVMVTFFGQVNKGWVLLRAGAAGAWAYINNIFNTGIEVILASIKKLGSIGGKRNPLFRFVQDLPEFGDASKEFATRIQEIEDNAKSQLKAIDENVEGYVAYKLEMQKVAEAAAALRREQERLFKSGAGGDSTVDEIKATTAALDDMDRAFDLIIGQFAELDAAAAAEFAGLGKVVAEATVEIDAMMIAMGNLVANGIGELVDGIFDADKNFKEFASNFLTNIAKMIIQTQILNALGGTAFGSAIGMGGGGSTPAAAPATAALTSPMSSRGSMGGSTTVNVINQTSSVAEVKETQNAQGEKTVEILIEEAVQKSMRRGGLDNNMASVYGVQRRGF